MLPQYDPYRQPSPPHPRYVEDYDYSRQQPPPSRGNHVQQDQHFPPPNRSYTEPLETMRAPSFSRSTSDLRGQQFYDRRRSPERQYYNTTPEPRYQNYEEDSYRGPSQEYDAGYERPPLNRNPSRGEESLPSAPSNRINNPKTQDSSADEAELWRQIRSRASEKAQSVSSSRSSSDSDTNHSRRSTETAPSSTASPISPSKNSEYPGPIERSPLHQTFTKEKSDHNRNISDPTTKVTLPVCRACDEPIRGRSLASQDGKLSGRYHKRCFCCTTCQKPFETASFYVLQDRPYCKQHYHELNNSTCAECGEGVEGQCLQLEDATIRHPDCFTCHVFPYQEFVLIFRLVTYILVKTILNRMDCRTVNDMREL